MLNIILATLAIESEEDSDLLISLFDRYKDYVFSIAKEMLGDYHMAEEVLGNVFSKVLKYRDKFVNIDEKRAASLMRLYTRHEVYNLKSRKERESQIFLNKEKLPKDNGAVLSPASPGADIEIEYITRETVNGIKEAIRSLDYPDNDILWLHLFHGHSSAEIGELYDLNPSTVRNIIKRAKEKLASSLKGSGII